MSAASNKMIVPQTMAATALAVVVYVATFVGASMVDFYVNRYIVGTRSQLIHFIVVLSYSGAAVALAKSACDEIIKTYASKAVCWGFLLLVAFAWGGGYGRWYGLRWVLHDLFAQTIGVVYVALVVF